MNENRLNVWLGGTGHLSEEDQAIIRRAMALLHAVLVDEVVEEIHKEDEERG